MILQSLRDLAVREHLVDDPAFESRPVRWVVELDGNGRFMGALDTNAPERLEEGSKKKPRLQATLMKVPRRVIRSMNIKADFLVDNAKYVFGWAAEADVKQDKRNTRCHAAFRKLLQDAAKECPDIDPVLQFLDNQEALSKCVSQLRREDFADNDLFTFRIEGKLLHENHAVRKYWFGTSTKAPASRGSAQCLICGEQKLPVRLHNVIKVSGAPKGVPLVSFDKPAFQKYGWGKNQNAPVCTDCMTAYVDGLRRLARHRTDPLSTILKYSTTAVYWADSSSDLVSNLPWLKEDPKKVRDLLHSPREGLLSSPHPKDRFFCIILTAVKGRIIVRRQHTGTVTDLVTNLRRYFAAIQLEHLDTSAPLPQFLLLRSIAFNGEVDRLSAEIVAELWLSALFDLPLSGRFLSAIVTRNRVEPQDLKQRKLKVGRERAALTQLYFVSHGKEPATNTDLPRNCRVEEMPQMGLKESSTDRAYLLGRILATAERMQMLAQPQGLNRTLVDRFFAMASVRPKVVFNQLMKLYGYHRSKALRDIRPLAKIADNLWGALLFQLNVDPSCPEHDVFGTSLKLEEQARFGLGYYHQRQKFLNDDLQAKEDRARRLAAGKIDSVEDRTLSIEETA